MLDVSGQVIGTTRLMAGGQPLVKTGGCVSLTCTAKLHVAPLPTPFVAEQLTVVVPTGKMLPEGGVHVTVGAGRPVEFTVKLTTAWPWPVVPFGAMVCDPPAVAVCAGTLVTVVAAEAALLQPLVVTTTV